MAEGSKQINFYALKEEIEAFLLRQKSLKIIGLPVFDKEIKSVDSLTSTNFKWLLQYRITRVDFLKNIKLKFVEKQNYYLVDSLRSPVIDLSLSYYNSNDKVLRRGRIYYQTQFYDEGKLIEKDLNFLNWANSFFNDFKKSIMVEKDKYHDALSEEVLKLLNANEISLISN